MGFESVNPATGETLATFDSIADGVLEQKIESSHEAYRAERSTPFDARARRMQSAADILEAEREKWARIATEEMGKTYRSALAEVDKCASVCRFYAEQAESFLGDEPIETEAERSFVRHLPIGPVLAIMPWNFPYWQVFRFAAPALMAGNTGLLKHASSVPRCALAIEEIFARAGFPEGCFTNLFIGVPQVEGVLADRRVRAATLTGSEGAGRAVAAAAGKQIKHTVLELGGSDPFIVMPSADLDAAVKAAVKGRTINNGQSCIAAKRFVVHRDIYDAFRERFVAAFEQLRVGDPMDDDTDIGPLASPGIRDELDEHVSKSIEQGARRLTGAEPIDGKGNFYRPGVLADIPDGSPAASEELFGPVASLFEAEDLDDAIRIGNATRFGLGSAIWSRDEGEIAQAIDELDAGATFVNSIVASDPRLPFGGVKQSGYGRELAREGIREFVNRKTISVTR